MTLFRKPHVPILLVRTAQASVAALLLHWLFHWPLLGPRALGLFFTPVLCLYFAFVFVGQWAWGLPILTRLHTRDNTAALTFDDGPSLENTPQILNILKTHGAIATFFVLGEQVEKHPDLVRRMIAEGHVVGSHAYRHKSLALASYGQVREALANTDVVLNSPWVRPPYGFKSLSLPFFIQKLGKCMVTWNVNPRDYALTDPQQIACRTLDKMRPGAIVLLHDGAANAATVGALPLILAGLHMRGFSCVGLPTSEELRSGE